LKNKEAVYRFDVKLRFRIIDTIDRHGISNKDILYLNRHNYFEKMSFIKSISKFDIGFEHGRQFQSAELFKRLFLIELMGADFDKPANIKYFTLRFPRVLKIYNNRSFKNTISFEKLQKIIRRCRKASEISKRKKRINLKSWKNPII
jgi:DNA ligase 4